MNGDSPSGRNATNGNGNANVNAAANGSTTQSASGTAGGTASEVNGEIEASENARLFAARREEELTRRDRSLAEFLVILDGYKPLVRLSFGSLILASIWRS